MKLPPSIKTLRSYIRIINKSITGMSYEHTFYSTPISRHILVELTRNFKRNFKHRKNDEIELDCYFCQTYLTNEIYRDFQNSVLEHYNGAELYCKTCHNLYIRLKSERSRSTEIIDNHFCLWNKYNAIFDTINQRLSLVHFHTHRQPKVLSTILLERPFLKPCWDFESKLYPSAYRYI